MSIPAKSPQAKQFSSGGIIVKNGPSGLKVLLIKDMYGHWTWPKGHIEAGESAQKAAIREIGEEVGLRDIRLVSEVSTVRYSYRLKGQIVLKTVYVYLFEANGDEEVKPLASEVAGAEWLDEAEGLKRLDYKGSGEVLRKAINIFKDR